MYSRQRLVMLLALWGTGGCSGHEPPLPPIGNGTFDVGTLVATGGAPPTEAIDRMLARAADILRARTGESMAQLATETTPPGDPHSLIRAYLDGRGSSAEGVVLMIDDPVARTHGGYSIEVPLRAGAQNEYPSFTTGTSAAYGVVLNFDHWYARCGYDDDLVRISAVSANGECRNRPGQTCVYNGRYWMCPGSVGDSYADQDTFRACIVVHELLHPFGSEGVNDHYGTPACRARTGMTAAEAGDLARLQVYCGMCPDVFRAFRRVSRVQ